MLRLTALVLLSLAVAAAASATAPLALQRLQSGQPLRIVCFGDSVTGVYYHTGGRRAWSDLLGLALQRRFPTAQVDVRNAGISGNTTRNALDRVDTDVIAAQPQLVVLMFGLNDAVRLTPEVYRANLHELARRIRAGGSELVFMTPNAAEPGDQARPPERVAAYAAIMREVARELGCPVADAHQAFLDARAGQPAEAYRLMSDPVHPNLRGHRLFAETAAAAIVGAPVPVGELPVLQPRLPQLLARLQAGQAVRVIAMAPFDTLIAAALHRSFPRADVRVTPWNPAGQTLPHLEEAAKALGWWKLHEHPEASPPDLVIVAIPAAAPAPDAAAYYRSYGWVLNWSQDMGKPHRWECLAVLPSVAQPRLTAEESVREALARQVIVDRDLPSVDRAAGDPTPTAGLLARELGRLLGGEAR